MSITALSADPDLEAIRISNETFFVAIRTTMAFILSGAMGREPIVTWNVPTTALESNAIVNCVGLVTVTGQVPSIPDNREVLTYEIYTAFPFARP